MRTKTFNLGIIGAGRIFDKHMSALCDPSNANFIVKGVAEKREERVKTIRKKCSFDIVSDFSEILHNEAVEIVSILTESGNHFKHAKLCIEAGKHVIVEKPVTLRLEDAEALAELAKMYGVNVYVVKQNRFNAAFQKLTTAVKTHKLGKVVGGSIRVRWCRDQAYYDQASWRGTWLLDGGALTNQAIHHLDLMCVLMGNPKSAFALSKTQLVDTEVEDQIVGVIEFENGALVSLEVTTAIRPHNVEAAICLYGSNGAIEISGKAVDELRFFLTGDDEKKIDILDTLQRSTDDVYGDGHVKLYNEVHKHLLNLPNEATLISCAMPSLKLLHCLYSSVELGRRVEFDEGLHSKRLGFE